MLITMWMFTSNYKKLLQRVGVGPSVTAVRVPLYFSRKTSGYTIVELLIATSLLTVVMSGLIKVFTTSSHSFSAMATHQSLGRGARNTLSLIERNLLGSRRVFSRAPPGHFQNFQEWLVLGSDSPLLDSSLPEVDENGVLSRSSGTFDSSTVGNSLLFAGIEAPVELLGVLDGAAIPRDLNIDIYRFHYYYLALDGATSVGGLPKIGIREWHSVPYADYNQLNFDLIDATLRSNAIIALVAQGIKAAFDVSAADRGEAFYYLVAGALVPTDPPDPHNIEPEKSGDMLKMVTDGLSGGFQYTVSPNTDQGFEALHRVPIFADWNSGEPFFPAGFEVMAVGSPGSRQVMMRLVLGARGNFRGLKSKDYLTLTTVYDVW